MSAAVRGGGTGFGFAQVAGGVGFCTRVKGPGSVGRMKARCDRESANSPKHLIKLPTATTPFAEDSYGHLRVHQVKETAVHSDT